jgi:SPX domain protein involved in polyphosphate accumulation
VIKELPPVVSSDERHQSRNQINRSDSPSSLASSTSTGSITTNPSGNLNSDEIKAGIEAKAIKTTKSAKKENIGHSPGERAFFKLLRAELNKATIFFDRANQELKIRDERMIDGIEIMKKPGSTMVTEKWSAMAKAVYRLYKDLLLLELYAIMTYTSFSKILKKHDKNTGYETRVKFMANVVNKANFTHYPDLLKMISHCEANYEEIDKILVTEGKSSSALDEDERLFISMIHRFYGQIMDKAEEEGANVTERKEGLGRRQNLITSSQKPKPESSVNSSLKSLIEENEANRSVNGTSACLSDDPEDNQAQNKRTASVISDELNLNFTCKKPKN